MGYLKESELSNFTFINKLQFSNSKKKKKKRKLESTDIIHSFNKTYSFIHSTNIYCLSLLCLAPCQPWGFGGGRRQSLRLRQFQAPPSPWPLPTYTHHEIVSSTAILRRVPQLLLCAMRQSMQTVQHEVQPSVQPLPPAYSQQTPRVEGSEFYPSYAQLSVIQP